MMRTEAAFAWSIWLVAVAGLGLSACTGTSGSKTPAGLVGQPLRVAVERYGASSDERELTVHPGEELPEFYNGLYPAVIDTLSAGTDARVRQLRWTGDARASSSLGRAWQRLRPGTPNRAVWAVERGGEWVVVDALEWGADVEF